MKKIITILGIFALILLGFYVAANYFSKAKNEKMTVERGDQQIKQSTHYLKDKNPEILTFIFQPSLNHNTQVTINFDKNYLTFTNIYPFNSEPPPPPKKNGEKISYTVEKAIKPFLSTLTNNEKTIIKNIVNKLIETDYNEIKGTYTDGTSYHFSIVFGKQLKVGYISDDKTVNQRNLIEEILNLVIKKNQYEENLPILSYYQNY